MLYSIENDKAYAYDITKKTKAEVVRFEGTKAILGEAVAVTKIPATSYNVKTLKKRFNDIAVAKQHSETGKTRPEEPVTITLL